MAKRKNKGKEKSEKHKRQMKFKRAESACLRWGLVAGENPRVIRRLQKEVEEHLERIAKLEHELEVAPAELEKARGQLKRASAAINNERLGSKVNRLHQIEKLLPKLLEDVEGVEFTEEQLELLRQYQKVQEA